MINVNFDKQNAKSNRKRENAHSFQIMLSNSPNLYKKYDAQISKRHVYMWKKL
jgi:hypothetical protein